MKIYGLAGVLRATSDGYPSVIFFELGSHSLLATQAYFQVVTFRGRVTPTAAV